MGRGIKARSPDDHMAALLRIIQEQKAGPESEQRDAIIGRLYEAIELLRKEAAKPTSQ